MNYAGENAPGGCDATKDLKKSPFSRDYVAKAFDLSLSTHGQHLPIEHSGRTRLCALSVSISISSEKGDDMTQSEMILRHLKLGRILTPASAMNLFDCYRLAARVHEIRRWGYRVITTRIPLSKGTGYVAQYSLK